MFYHTLSLINKDHLINLCTQKLSLSFQVTTVLTLSCSPIYFQFLLSSWHCCVPKLRVCHHQYLGDEGELDMSQVGVGRFCKHPYTTNLSPHNPPQIPFAPSPQSLSAPRALIPYGFLGPILRISWAYIDHIFALYIGPVTFSEHFQHSPTTSSPHLHNNS